MKHNYSNVNDFLHDDSFVRWVLYKENDEYWQWFMTCHSAHPGLMDKGKELILTVWDAEDEQMPDAGEVEVWRRITEELRVNASPGREESLFDRKFLWVYGATLRWTTLRWAAGILLLLTIGWIAFHTPDKSDETVTIMEGKQGTGGEVLSEVVNTGIVPMTVPLADGSTVVLQKDSKLSYGKHFGASDREVFLSGEAFFEVTKDSLRPFLVYTDGIVTKVLGTSFTVRAFENDREVEVNVKTGKVSVFKQDPGVAVSSQPSPIILAPNQKLVFSRKNERFDLRLVDNPLPIKELSEYPRQRFEEISFPDVLKLLEDRYGVQFVYDRNLLERCVITTTLNDDPLFDNLDVVCRTIGATYKEQEARIVIESEGCNIR